MTKFISTQIMDEDDALRVRRGRPPLRAGRAASSWIQLRVTRSRKAAYQRAARATGSSLSGFAINQLDRASGHKEEAR